MLMFILNPAPILGQQKAYTESNMDIGRPGHSKMKH